MYPKLLAHILAQIEGESLVQLVWYARCLQNSNQLRMVFGNNDKTDTHSLSKQWFQGSKSESFLLHICVCYIIPISLETGDEKQDQRYQ